jgi:hypothetical protein
MSLYQSGSTPLLHAAMHGHLDTVQLLLSWRVDINAQNDVSLTAFYHICMFLSLNTSLCVPQWGCTALMLAARYGQVATLKLLLLFHPDAKIIDKVWWFLPITLELRMTLLALNPSGMASLCRFNTGREDCVRMGGKCRNQDTIVL